MKVDFFIFLLNLFFIFFNVFFGVFNFKRQNYGVACFHYFGAGFMSAVTLKLFFNLLKAMG